MSEKSPPPHRGEIMQTDEEKAEKGKAGPGGPAKAAHEARDGLDGKRNYPPPRGRVWRGPREERITRTLSRKKRV